MGFKKFLVFLLISVTISCNCIFADGYNDDGVFEGPMEMWDNKGNYFIKDEDGSYYYKDKQGNTVMRDENGDIYIKDKEGYTHYFEDGENAFAYFGDVWFGMNSVGSRNGGPGVAEKDGWKMLGYDKWVYIENGQQVRNTWKMYKGAWYYLGSNGEMVTGWQNINGKIFYFNEAGAMATGDQLIDGVDRYFSPDGVLVY